MITSNAASFEAGAPTPANTAQADLFSENASLYERIRARFLQQSAAYMGASTSRRDIEAFLKRRFGE